MREARGSSPLRSTCLGRADILARRPTVDQDGGLWSIANVRAPRPRSFITNELRNSSHSSSTLLANASHVTLA
jgi:hypothetical protein